MCLVHLKNECWIQAPFISNNFRTSLSLWLIHISFQHAWITFLLISPCFSHSELLIHLSFATYFSLAFYAMISVLPTIVIYFSNLSLHFSSVLYSVSCCNNLPMHKLKSLNGDMVPFALQNQNLLLCASHILLKLPSLSSLIHSSLTHMPLSP